MYGLHSQCTILVHLLLATQTLAREEELLLSLSRSRSSRRHDYFVLFFIYPCSLSCNTEPDESLVLRTHASTNDKLVASVTLAPWLLCARCETHAETSHTFLFQKYVFGSDISHPRFRFYPLSRVFVLVRLSLAEQRQETLCLLRSVAMRHRTEGRCSREGQVCERCF